MFGGGKEDIKEQKDRGGVQAQGYEKATKTEAEGGWRWPVGQPLTCGGGLR